jgi:uncharacterized membrane protein
MRFPISAPALFLALALAGGVPLVFFTPPFQVPDEPAHFLRAYAVSEGRLLARNQGRRTGDVLPVSLRELVALCLGDVPGHPERRIDPAALARARALELRPGERELLSFPNTALYSPLPYLPQAAGIALARAAGLRPLGLLYAARLANLLAAALLIAAALRALPAYGWLLAALASLPMALFLRSSVSADALTLAFALYLAARIARLAFVPGAAVGRADVALVASASAALCLTKLPYAPLVLAVFAIPRGGGDRRRRAALVAAALSAAAVACLASSEIAAAVTEPVRTGAGVDPAAQIETALAHPQRFAALVAENVWDRGPGYAVEFLGRLGWLDTALPLPALAVLGLGLLALLGLDTSPAVRVRAGQRILLGALAACSTVAVLASQYAMWTPYGAAWIEGVQGRYFHPLAPFAVWICHHPRWASLLSPRSRLALAGLLALFGLAATWLAIQARYYVP